MIQVREGKNLDFCKQVHVYRNRHRKCYSIKQGGYVVAYADELAILSPKFKVSEAGRQRVIREGRKNVHAYIKGFIIERGPDTYHTDWRPMTYNPYRHTTFVDKNTEKPVGFTPGVWLQPTGAMYAN